MFSQSFESMISMINIPPLVCFLWAAKIGGEIQTKKLSKKEFGIHRFARMFTGIIETQGIIKKVTQKGANKVFWIKSPISQKLKPDQSLAHDGVCLTIEEVKQNRHRVTAISETLDKTGIGNWQEGSVINLERCLKIKDRLDGHFVQGHVDTVAICTHKKACDGSWEFSFQFPLKFGQLIIEKGSVAVNGISLTAFNVTANSFDVAIIPYTLEHTNMNTVNVGQKVNIEFDMLGKYINRKLSLSK